MTTRTAVGPFSTVDADTRQRIMKNRCWKLSSAFERGDRYVNNPDHPDRDFLVLDAQDRPVPRPHKELPSPMLDRKTPAVRYLEFRREAKIRRLVRKAELDITRERQGVIVDHNAA